TPRTWAMGMGVLRVNRGQLYTRRPRRVSGDMADLRAWLRAKVSRALRALLLADDPRARGICAPRLGGGGRRLCRRRAPIRQARRSRDDAADRRPAHQAPAVCAALPQGRPAA